MDTRPNTTLILMAAAAIGIWASVYLPESNYQPLLFAVFVGLLTIFVFHYVDDGKHAHLSIETKWVKLTASALAAVYISMVLLAYLGPIYIQPSGNLEVAPEPDSWVAIANDGTQTDITINDSLYANPNISKFLQSTQWNINWRSTDTLRIVTEGGTDLGWIGLQSLGALGFFNYIWADSIAITDRLTVNGEDDLGRFRIRFTSFGGNSMNNYTLRDNHDQNIFLDSLPSIQSKSGHYFEHDNEHYLIMVPESDHTHADSAWTRFSLVSFSVGHRRASR